MKGRKIWEGGIRMPMIARSPGRILGDGHGIAVPQAGCARVLLAILLAVTMLSWGSGVRGAEANSPYAVVAHISRGEEHEVAKREFRLMREAGIGWVRTDFDWSGVEPQRGVWTFDHLDETLDWAEAEGVRILPILDYDVPWARPAHEHLDQWLDYVRRVVTRYKDRLRYWEVWNEPNLEAAWHDTPSPENYVKLLNPTYEEIKRIDPGLVVLLGGTSSIPWPYLEGIYKAGGQAYFDVMNVHPYCYPRPPEAHPGFDELIRLRHLMTEHDDVHKPIWITEIGWPTHRGPRGVSPQVQAQMLARAYLLALQVGVRVTFWYEFQAPEEKPDHNEHHFGIVHRDLSPKPAYAALKTLARVRPAGSENLEGPWQTGNLYYPHWRRPDGHVAWALWRVGNDETLQLRVQGTLLKTFDHLGESLDLNVEGHRVRLTVGPSPIYLIGPTQLGH